MLLICGFSLIFLVSLKHVTCLQFTCQGKPSGYYADVNTGCQVYHMCDGLGRQFSYTCPNATLFQQRMMICDHWYMVNCSRSEVDYRANLLLGQRDKPFVEDSEKEPYERTPRPDLLSNPSEPEYNFARSGRIISETNVNRLVGVEAEPDKENDTFRTDEPLYFVPSHWSTEYSKGTTTESNVLGLNPTFTGVREKPRGFSRTTIEPKQSTIKKKKLDSKQSIKKESTNSVNQSRNPEKKRVVGKDKRPSDSIVNFPSDFENTTPQFPTFVDDASKRFEIEEQVYVNNETEKSKVSTHLEPPRGSLQNKRKEFSIEDKEGLKPPTAKVKKQNQDLWQELRKKYFIPDVLFPLDPLPRPGYGDAPTSFQVKTVPVYVTNDTSLT